jgi:hypothetical protein
MAFSLVKGTVESCIGNLSLTTLDKTTTRGLATLCTVVCSADSLLVLAGDHPLGVYT